MYVKVVLTLILLATTAVAVAIWRRPPARIIAPPLSPAEQKLAENIDRLDLRGVTRHDAVALLQQRVGIPLSVDWNTVGGTQVAPSSFRDEKLDFDLRDVPLWFALQRILGYNVRYWTDHGHIMVRDDSRYPIGGLITRIYDVRDLISDAYWGVSSRGANADAVAAARVNALRDIVIEGASGNSWVELGGLGAPGGYGSISAFGGRLIVSQTADVQVQVERVLAGLRCGHGPVRMR